MVTAFKNGELDPLNSGFTSDAVINYIVGVKLVVRGSFATSRSKKIQLDG